MNEYFVFIHISTDFCLYPYFNGFFFDFIPMD